jgi:hypothetical protein
VTAQREDSWTGLHLDQKTAPASLPDALDALDRAEKAKALRERYGLTEPEKPQSS